MWSASRRKRPAFSAPISRNPQTSPVRIRRAPSRVAWGEDRGGGCLGREERGRWSGGDETCCDGFLRRTRAAWGEDRGHRMSWTGGAGWSGSGGMDCGGFLRSTLRRWPTPTQYTRGLLLLEAKWRIFEKTS